MAETSNHTILPSRVTHKYGDHDLQTLSIWPVSNSVLYEPQVSKILIIYIHGGAWRDPTINNLSFTHTITSLLTSHTTLKQHIAAFASIDYRLSPHPSHPQDPATTPSSALRDATHPDHINDVLTGIKLIQDKYSFGDNYILVGHSCGATLALQTLMQDALDIVKVPITSPSAIIGVCGIYDVNLMIANHASSPYAQVYKDFVVGAFGDDEEVWDQVSPAQSAGFGDKDGSKRLLLLAASQGDELVESAQIEVMAEKIRGLGENFELLVQDDLKGGHDEIWREGWELADVLSKAVEWLTVRKQ